MFVRFIKCVVLAALAVLVAAAPAGAFGRRSAAPCVYTPVYYTDPCCYPWYWPPCPPPVVIPTGVDCVCNRTAQTLRIHISSGFGSTEAIVPPGHCFYFLFRKDNMKNRVVTAFALDNDLVANFAFPPLDQLPLPKHRCLQIRGTTAAPATVAPDREEMGAPGMIGQPSNAAL